MKALKYLMIVMISFFALSCADDTITPRGDDDDDPIEAGGTNGGGGGSGSSGG